MFFIIGKGNVVEGHFPFYLRQGYSTFFFLDVGHGVDRFKDAVGSGQGFLDVTVDFTDAANGISQVNGIDEEGNQGTGRHFSIDDTHAAIPDDAGYGNGRKELDKRRQ